MLLLDYIFLIYDDRFAIVSSSQTELEVGYIRKRERNCLYTFFDALTVYV